MQAISGTLVPVILARAAGTAAVGIYRVARLPIVAANTLQAPMRLAMFPEQSRLVAEGADGRGPPVDEGVHVDCVRGSGSWPRPSPTRLCLG